MINMDELEKRAQKGLESFKQKGDIDSVKSALDGMVDNMLDDDDGPGKSSDDGKNNLKWIWITLAVILLGFVGYMGYQKSSTSEEVKVEPAVIYAQYFDVLPNARVAKERGESAEDLSDNLLNGLASYDEGNFEEAAKKLKEIDDSEAHIFAAISEMNLNNHQEAIQLLSNVKSRSDFAQYKDIVDWYLSLSYIKTNDLQKAKEVLKDIASGDHYKKEEAAQILKTITD